MKIVFIIAFLPVLCFAQPKPELGPFKIGKTTYADAVNLFPPSDATKAELHYNTIVLSDLVFQDVNLFFYNDTLLSLSVNPPEAFVNTFKSIYGRGIVYRSTYDVNYKGRIVPLQSKHVYKNKNFVTTLGYNSYQTFYTISDSGKLREIQKEKVAADKARTVKLLENSYQLLEGEYVSSMLSKGDSIRDVLANLAVVRLSEPLDVDKVAKALEMSREDLMRLNPSYDSLKLKKYYSFYIPKQKLDVFIATKEMVKFLK